MAKAKPNPTDRLPPHEPLSEQAACGCLLQLPSECLDAADEAGLALDWFYDLRHQAIWQSCVWLREHNQPIELISVMNRLKETELLNKIGGLTYLNACQDAAPSAANFSYYVDKLRDQWLARRIIASATEAAAQAYEPGREIDKLIGDTVQSFQRIEELGQGRTAEEKALKAILIEEVIPGIEKNYHRGSAQIEGLTTGLPYLDKMLGGMGGENGNFLVLAGRPGTGKTATAIQIAWHVAKDAVWWTEKKDGAGNVVTALDEKTGDYRAVMERHVGKPVGIFSLEMGRKSLGRRILFQVADADLQRFRTGYATNKDLLPLVKAGETLAAGQQIYIDHSSGITIGQLKSRARRWHRQHGVRFFVVDYFQLLRTDNKHRRQSRVEELEEISAELLALGKELDCPFLVLCQMNRDWERDPTRTPQLSDLKGCGAVEQDAHVVMFLYKPKLSDANAEFYEKCMAEKFGEKWKKWDGHPQRINALVAKNREGPTGKAELLFMRSSTKFFDWNDWLKRNKYKTPAAGEGQYKGEEFDVPDDERSEER